MNWFGKKEDAENEKISELPKLPELPRLSDFGRNDEYNGDGERFQSSQLPRLPSYPDTHFGKDFSKSAIKDAVVGKKTGDNDEFADESFHQGTMQIPSRHISREMPDDYDAHEDVKGYPVIRKQRVKETEPIYIRLDKFNESAKIFDSTMSKINDIQRTLGEIKKIRQEEEAELGEWEREIQEIKRQLDKVDREVFSGV